MYVFLVGKFILLCIDVKVMSSAYIVRFTGDSGVGSV